jgi:hypothetical protein
MRERRAMGFPLSEMMTSFPDATACNRLGSSRWLPERCMFASSSVTLRVAYKRASIILLFYIFGKIAPFVKSIKCWGRSGFPQRPILCPKPSALPIQIHQIFLAVDFHDGAGAVTGFHSWPRSDFLFTWYRPIQQATQAKIVHSS